MINVFCGAPFCLQNDTQKQQHWRAKARRVTTLNLKVSFEWTLLGIWPKSDVVFFLFNPVHFLQNMKAGHMLKKKKWNGEPLQVKT